MIKSIVLYKDAFGIYENDLTVDWDYFPWFEEEQPITEQDNSVAIKADEGLCEYVARLKEWFKTNPVNLDDSIYTAKIKFFIIEGGKNGR